MSAAEKLRLDSQAHKNVFVALAQAQIEMGPVVKGSVNPHFKSHYADLADVYSVALPALNRNGLALHANIVVVDNERVMRTTISHGDSDTHVYCDVPLIVQKNDMQGMKSATTYAKRIGAESLCGIAPEDDDGNKASAKPPPPPSRSEDNKGFGERYTAQEHQRRILFDIAKSASISDPDLLKKLAAHCMNKPMSDLKLLVADFLK